MRLFVFGLGYSAHAFIRSNSWTHVAGTVREHDKAQRLRQQGISAYALSQDDADLGSDLRRADAILVSVPPSGEGDPVLSRFSDEIASSNAAWIGYLSTTGVYGDHGGAWIDETTPARPQSRSSVCRHAAEDAWLALGQQTGKAVQIFRLTGIYGPGRNAFVNLAQGTARRIVKLGQVFNRIHVDDIATTLSASLRKPRVGAIYNVSDDEPAPPQDVVAYAAQLAGVEPPPETAFEAAEMSAAARSFYAENKRVSNGLIKDELGVRLLYPTYREGLQALYAAGEFTQAA
ncbi:SDR family oxidoreductase [Microvirga guangxiensis]|uniref:Nucleoside-diphosphate-sugar epimerase n=1 Tax=Microvirga guangxiensis TaxID=549386 RepID=A0A1G5LA85_9HYPH|nr:SDR family oxidoreductase [Microvirga guangxiensis]SCZ09873.1 Nucleoside-diphosphate-sugar epimerase [Microvirga guangxiensis]